MSVQSLQSNFRKSYPTGKLVGLILGIVLFLLINFVLPIEGLSQQGISVLATIALMATWWITEAIDTGITGLVPLVLFPLTQAMGASATAAAYGNNTIFMFFGGFAISLALERWNLHNRIALNIIKLVGTSINRLTLGLMVAGGFISMWVSNTATILMLLPIAIALAEKISELMKKENGYSEKDSVNFKKSAIFAVGFGAIIGGNTTIIGTPTNMLVSGFALSLLNIDLAFGNFMLFMLPISIAQYVLMAWVLTKVVYKINIKQISNAKSIITEEIEQLGEFKFEEKIVSVVFFITVFFWLSRTYLFANVAGLSDTVISIIACVALYSIPSKNFGQRILDADSIKRMPWNVVLMLMGGMAVAAGFTNTDLATYLGSLLLRFNNVSTFGLIVIISLAGLIMTQIAPNTASATILIPISASIAVTTGSNPLLLMMAAALSTGFATTLPSGTPLMGIMYGTGYFKVSELVKVGVILAIVSEILMVFVIYFLGPVFFG